MSVKLKSYPQVVSIAFILIMVVSFCTSCQSSSEPFPGPGKLLLLRTLEKNDLPTHEIYEWKQGQNELELLWDNLPSLPALPNPVVSPNGNYAILSGNFLINLQTGEGSMHEIGDEGLYATAAFSPDGTSLATMTKAGLSLLDVETLEEKIILHRKCATYDCGENCIAMEFPFWIDDETILVLAHPGTTDPEYSLPSEMLHCEYNLGSTKAAVLLDKDANVHNTIETGLFEIPRIPKQFEPSTGPTLIGETVDGLEWVDTAELYQGIFNPHGLDIEFPYGNYYLLPDGNRLLHWKDDSLELVELRTGETKSLGDEPILGESSFVNCASLPGSENVVCNRGVDLFLLSLSGEENQILQVWEKKEEMWRLLAWIP